MAACKFPAMADDCIFCKIVAGELPAEVVQEDDHTIAFMDLNPWTRGHALVVPRNHSKNLYEAPEEDLRQRRRGVQAAGTHDAPSGWAATGSTCSTAASPPPGRRSSTCTSM